MTPRPRRRRSPRAGSSPFTTRSDAATVVGTSRNAPVELRVATPEDYGSALFQATGSDAARRRGDAPRAAVNHFHASEDALYASLGLAFIAARAAPGHRRNRSRRDRLRCRRSSNAGHPRRPAHAHDLQRWARPARRRWSRAAHALGYEYIAITDHSAGAAASRTLARDDIAQQRDEIDGCASSFPG